MYSAPAPLAAWILCAETEIMSAPSVLARNGTFRKPCTASVWNSASGESRRVALTMSAMGMTAPVSLLTIMTETRMVSGRSAFLSASTVMFPSRSGCR